MKTTLLIMAAGIGSRFGTGIKQLEPVDDAGHIIMDYSIHDAIEAGFNHVVFIIRKDIEKEFKEVIGNRIASICSSHNVTVDYAFQDINDIPGILPEGRTKPWGGLATLKTKTEIKTAWATASINLFGKELGQNTYTGEGRETEPTETEIKAVWEKDNSAAGLYGAVMNAEVKLQTATENVEKAAQFDKVTAQLAAWKKSLANAKDAYIADNKEVLDAVVAAQKVVTENVATPITALGMDKDRALLGEINAVLEFSANDSDEALIIKHVNDLIETLQTEIGVKKGSFNEETGAYVETSTDLYLKIEKAESDVFEAQKMLDLYNSGDLTEQYVVDTAKAAYEAAKAQYEKDLETFNYWNAKLAELMACCTAPSWVLWTASWPT